jgi:broad specificity phosphatase PhoE
MTEIWFIRHGESESNAGLPTSDTAKIVLTPRGFAQAEHIAKAFTRAPSLIITSPYLRARQSAQPAIERFPRARLEEWPVHEYTYLSLASRHGTTLQGRRPLIDAYWERCDPHELDGEGAETFAELVVRAEQTIERIKDLKDDFVAIFSHGLFMRTLTWALLAGPVQVDSATMRRYRGFISGFSVPNGSIMKMHLNAAQEILFGGFDISHLPADLQ